MIDRNDKIEGPYSFTEDTSMRGMVTIEATVEPRVRFELYGMVTGDLIVKDSAECFIHGMVNGTVRNRGGTVIIHGMVDGIVDENANSNTTVMPGAHIGERS